MGMGIFIHDLFCILGCQMVYMSIDRLHVFSND